MPRLWVRSLVRTHTRLVEQPINVSVSHSSFLSLSLKLINNIDIYGVSTRIMFEARIPQLKNV